MESNQNTEKKASKHQRHYPKVSCVPFCNITDRLDYTNESLETGYRTGNYIHTIYGNVLNGDKVKGLKNQHSKMNDLEGLKLVLDWHGDNYYNITLYGDEIDQLRSTLEMVKAFLEEHKDAKVYIENEACYGAENLRAIDEGMIKGQVNLWDLVMEYLGKYKNRVYCRQVKKDYIHTAGRWTVKNIRNAYHNCKHSGKLDKTYLNTAEKPQEVKDCGTFQYFPLSDVGRREDEMYSGLWGKRKKNKFLNWSKFDGAEPPMSSGDYANKEGYCYSKAINPECWSETDKKQFETYLENIAEADKKWKQGFGNIVEKTQQDNIKARKKQGQIHKSQNNQQNKEIKYEKEQKQMDNNRCCPGNDKCITF